MAKTPWSFGHSECNRVKQAGLHKQQFVMQLTVNIDFMDIYMLCFFFQVNLYEFKNFKDLELFVKRHVSHVSRIA